MACRVVSLFLALDRLVEDRRLRGKGTPPGRLAAVPAASEFGDLSGPGNMEKRLAAGHLTRLYAACGGRERFDDARGRRRIAAMREEAEPRVPNDRRPRGARCTPPTRAS